MVLKMVLGEVERLENATKKRSAEKEVEKRAKRSSL
jgi:hypothetical protein